MPIRPNTENIRPRKAGRETITPKSDPPVDDTRHMTQAQALRLIEGEIGIPGNDTMESRAAELAARTKIEELETSKALTWKQILRLCASACYYRAMEEARRQKAEEEEWEPVSTTRPAVKVEVPPQKEPKETELLQLLINPMISLMTLRRIGHEYRRSHEFLSRRTVSNINDVDTGWDLPPKTSEQNIPPQQPSQIVRKQQPAKPGKITQAQRERLLKVLKQRTGT